MTTPAHAAPAAASTKPRLRTWLVLLGAILVALAANTLVALLGVAAGAGSAFEPLHFPIYGAFTVLGVLIGWVGWQLVQRRSTHPTATLRVLVPAVLIGSFLPDLVLLVLRFLPDTTVAGGVALMAMHLVVAGVAVPSYVMAGRVSASR